VWAADLPGAVAPRTVGVSVASRNATTATGTDGMVFSVRRADGSASGASVHVSVDYSSFAYAYGGDYASRLRLVELPSCALTTPQVAACRTQAPVPSSRDDVSATSLGADVALPADGAAVVLAATSTPSGSAGNFTATSLSEAGSWSAGGESGAFTYSYPITVPPVPGGLEPDVSLGYDSQKADGLTSSTNDQASWAGDGWDYSPGYIEENYQSCEQNASPEPKTGDFCYSSNDETTLSLGGQDTTLVHDSSSGAWVPEDDNGEQVSFDSTGSSSSNGTYNGDYWVVTQTNGDKYYFGLNELPGYTSGHATTNSAWTLPVYSTASGQPCYKSAGFTSSSCPMAWRWNLDYVTDPEGNAIAYFYGTEPNSYADDNGTKADATYTRGGELTKIEYGLRAGSEYSETPAAEVTFTTPGGRSDAPTDLSCTSGDTCDVMSPTFWTSDTLTTIATESLEGSSQDPVDSYALGHSYLATGDTTSPASLDLTSITRTGKDGGSVTLPPVSFAYTALPNRVETPTDTSDGYSIITRMRLTSVANETGATTTIGYAAPGGACTSGGFPAPDDDTLACFPDYWSPPGQSSPVLDWFNKYAVSYVDQQDATGAGPIVAASYHYAGAGWHYDDDALTRSSQRTWDQWRGYRTVTTQTGTSPDPVSETVHTYLQGMNGDYQSNGSTSSVSVTDGQGDTVADQDQYAGTDLESVTDDGAGGSMVADTVTLPWASGAVATQSQPSPLPSLEAFLTGTQETKVYTALAAGGTRQSDTTYTHDSHGRVVTESGVPDTTSASEDTCTTTTYASNTSLWIMDLPSEAQVTSVPCGTTATLPADAVSDTISLYDGATSLSADTPTEGNLTETELAASYTGTTPDYIMQSKDTHDTYGRVLTSTDADGRTTTTAYSPATGAEPTQDTVTDPKGLVTTTTYDPARDLPLVTTNPAAEATTEQYDALGRLTAVWTPGNAASGPATDKFAYTVANAGPTYTISSTLEPNGTSYLENVTIYDSLGRTRETQQQMGSGGWDVTDTVYNSLGEETVSAGPYYESSVPSPVQLVGAAEDEIPSEDTKVYDGAGRVTADVSSAGATETWETDTAYGGDYTTTTDKCESSIPKCGGTPETTFTDGRGLTTAAYQYHAGVTVSPADPASDYDKTSYTYTPGKKLATITDSAGNKWSYSYNLHEDQTSQTDPDAGTTASSYDAAGQLTSTTSADRKTTSYAYDLDGRKIATYDTTGGAAESSSDEIASWTYDTLKKGLLTSSSSYYGGQAYTEAVYGYNSFGKPTETYTTIPSGAGALAGTYGTIYNYTPTGQVSSYEDSAAGGLPQETVSTTYNSAAQPTSLKGTWAYADSLSYTEYGQAEQYDLGPTSAPAYIYDTYDPQTQRLTGQQVQAGVTPATIDDLSYGYNNAGDILWENDSTAGQSQCFDYDYLDRLHQAWSQSAGCTAASTPSASAESTAAAPYLETYTDNPIGDLTAEASTSPAGAVTTTDDSYPATGSAQPHAPAASAVTGGPAPGTTTYAYDPSGQLTSQDGPSGSETLSWADDGKLASVTSPPTASSPTTSYDYDAGGKLLIEDDPGQDTLFLNDEEIVLDTTTAKLSGTRFYTIGGQVIATRSSSGDVQYLAGDQQGTASIAIDSATLNVTRRYYDPFGNQVGAAPASWPGEQGFVGGTADATTGLVNLGAREYNPAGGAFISPDPLLDPTVPQDLNAYAYAGDNPTTNSDPTGANYIVGLPGGGECTGSLQYCGSLYNKLSGGGGTNRSSHSGSASGSAGSQVNGNTFHAENPPYTDAPAPSKGDGSHSATHTVTNGSTGYGGSGGCPGGDIHSRYAGGACVPTTSAAGVAEEAVDGYGPEKLSCQGFYLCEHARGEAQIAIVIVAIPVGALCGGCDGPVAAAAFAATTGSAEAAAAYEVSGGHHDTTGLVGSIILGAGTAGAATSSSNLLIHLADGLGGSGGSGKFIIPIITSAAVQIWMSVAGDPSHTPVNQVMWSGVNGGASGVTIPGGN
jgi:RHS repeat-associated protein